MNFTLPKPEWVPHPYQVEGIRRLLTQGSVGLFLDPGLGKTSIVLAAFKLLKEKGLAKKMLVIAPLRPCYAVWPAELAKWANFAGLSCAILHGAGKAEALAADADIYITNPESLFWLYGPSQTARPEFDVLCVDESTKFKNPSTRRFKLFRPHVSGFKRRWILTGTPSPNGVADLFGQIYLLDLGATLGRYITHFRAEYFYRAGFSIYEWLIRPGAFQEIVAKIAPLIYQLSAEDYLTMPERIEVDIPVTLPPAAQETYRQVEDEFITMLDAGVVVAANTAVAGVKCRQIANGAVYMGEEWAPIHSEKISALESLVEELAGQPALLLYEFQHDCERILASYPDAPVLGAGLSPKRLEAVIARFNAGEIPLLIGHPASMGHGLNLQGACHHIVWFGIPWNLEFYDQAIARVYRQGQQSKHVYIYHLIAQGTLDEKVLKVLKSKDRAQQQLLDALTGKDHVQMERLTAG